MMRFVLDIFFYTCTCGFFFFHYTKYLNINDIVFKMFSKTTYQFIPHNIKFLASQGFYPKSHLYTFKNFPKISDQKFLDVYYKRYRVHLATLGFFFFNSIHIDKRYFLFLLAFLLEELVSLSIGV
jgi:hypothetical protein